MRVIGNVWTVSHVMGIIATYISRCTLYVYIISVEKEYNSVPNLQTTLTSE